MLVVAHEVSHVIDHMGEYIGDEGNMAGEIRAYLSGHLAKQIFRICLHEKFKNAGKKDRSKAGKKSEGARRPELQVDIDGNGSAGPFGLPEGSVLFSGTKNDDGKTVSEANPGLYRSEVIGLHSVDPEKLPRH